MSESKTTTTDPAPAVEHGNPTDAAAARERTLDRREAQRWWVKLMIQPALLLLCGAVLLTGLGIAQRLGFISAGSVGDGSQASAGGAAVDYICPMMCTPPQSEPGRCPVCAMELVPATSGGGDGDSRSISIDPAARRVANIQTVAVTSMPMTRTIRAIGELSYDEGSLKTISAYVDGRLDRLYADYTGVVVQQGDHLAWVYSPRLYSAQVEYLLARKARNESRGSTLSRVMESSRELLDSARQRLIELGMTESQIDAIDRAGEANSRMHLCAPISGTVIQKYAVEGQYVKEGEAIYGLADLSTVWLMLELFPEDAATIRYGQKVEAVVQSLPSKTFIGRVAFVDPQVNPKTRTVGVRVVIPNDDGLLRVGDYAKATIDAPVSPDHRGAVYDAELANKWISPRHPHVVEDAAGDCRICGVPLVPAARFGFTDEATAGGESLVVPRSAVLMAGDNSVVYVESEPGQFEIRQVTLGPSSGEQIVILEGVAQGEQVASRGNFLIDSQMQLAGNPSLIDPMKAQPRTEIELTEEMIAALSELSPEDRALAEAQRICPVADHPLGSMGAPPKVDVNGTLVFLCCAGCRSALLEDPEKYLAKLNRTVTEEQLNPKVAAALAELSDADREIAQRQRICPVAEFPLGAMGTPIKVDVNGTPVFICCEGCRGKLLNEPDRHLAKLARLKSANGPDTSAGPSLPPIGEINLLEPQSGLPPISTPQPIESDEVNHADLPPVRPIAEMPTEGVR